MLLLLSSAACSFHVVRVHCAAVLIAKVAIVHCSVVRVHCASQGRLLIGWVLLALSPHMPHWFVQEGVDGARFLAIAPLFLVDCFFG